MEKWERVAHIPIFRESNSSLLFLGGESHPNHGAFVRVSKYAKAFPLGSGLPTGYAIDTVGSSAMVLLC